MSVSLSSIGATDSATTSSPRAPLSIKVPAMQPPRGRHHVTPCGKFVLHHLIQSGAHGAVYAARRCQAGTEAGVGTGGEAGAGAGAGSGGGRPVPEQGVAVKVAQGAPNVRRLATEALLLSQLPPHAHVVKMVSPASQHHVTGALYLPMELCDTDLLEVLVSGPRLPLAHTLHMMLQLTSALHHLHSHGVYHLDLKPDNVLVDLRHKCLKLADFGMAARLQGDDAHRLVGQHGSAGYAAPEVWDLKGGRQPHTGVSAAPVDVWSLGAVFFTMLFRRRCWSDVTLKDKDFRHYLRTGRFLMYDGDQVPDRRLMAILYAMLSVDPSARPPLRHVAHLLTGLYNEQVAAAAAAPSPMRTQAPCHTVSVLDTTGAGAGSNPTPHHAGVGSSGSDSGSDSGSGSGSDSDRGSDSDHVPTPGGPGMLASPPLTPQGGGSAAAPPPPPCLVTSCPPSTPPRTPAGHTSRTVEGSDDGDGRGDDDDTNTMFVIHMHHKSRCSVTSPMSMCSMSPTSSVAWEDDAMSTDMASMETATLMDGLLATNQVIPMAV